MPRITRYGYDVDFLRNSIIYIRDTEKQLSVDKFLFQVNDINH